MKFKILLFILFSSFNLLAQNISDFDKTLKIDLLKIHENEIRIYKKYATSTGLEMFRLYNVKEDYWKAELYQTKARTIDNIIKIRVVKEKLNSLSNLELIWFKILDTDVLYLPDFDRIGCNLP